MEKLDIKNLKETLEELKKTWGIPPFRQMLEWRMFLAVASFVRACSTTMI